LPGDAEPVDAEFHDVAGLQPDRRAVAHPDAGRGAGVDEVAGFEDHELAQVVDDHVRVEDHRPGVAGLPADPVDIEPHVEIAHVGDLVRGGQPRARRG
jgi:hypothetical protein